MSDKFVAIKACDLVHVTHEVKSKFTTLIDCVILGKMMNINPEFGTAR